MVKVEIYMRDFCGFCRAAEQLLKNKGIEYERINIWKDSKRKSEMIERSKGKSTVPQIFINNNHVGGCDNLFALEKAGRLDGLLAR